MTGLVDRHVDFLHALRAAGIPVSLAEGVDAVAALSALRWDERETVRTAYAATVLKRQSHRPTFDTLFDLYFPRLVGGPVAGADDPAARTELRETLLAALVAGDLDAQQALALDAVGRFGAMPGRGPGLSSWSAYTAVRRLSPDDLVGRIVAALMEDGRTEDEAGRVAASRVGAFTALVEAEARRRIAEEKGADHVAEVAVRPSIDRLDFTAAKRADLEQMRREVYPLARRLATRLARERHARRRGPLDFRRTVRASISTGGVPITTYHRPKRPHRTELVVLCDVSGSVSSFARFTLMLVFALREQFQQVRAFTFVDQVHEVTRLFVPGADPGDVLADLAASSEHAARWGRTNYGRAFADFEQSFPHAIGPKSSLLVLGDARSNYSDLALPVLRDLSGRARHRHWLNPEHRRHWDTGDSAASAYGEIVPMVECRNLNQLAAFVHDLV
ncbi:MAG: VWA domain-containing protein [Nocardioides sp.]